MRNNRQCVESTKEKYPPGTRIELGCMNDTYAPCHQARGGRQRLCMIPARFQDQPDGPGMNQQRGGMKFE